MRNDMNRFSMNPVNLDISRSAFDMDHSVKLSFNVGDVIPFFYTEVLPSDTFTVDTNKVVRMQPLVSPIMDNVFLDTYYFFVPYRIVWEHWKEFFGENTQTAWIPSVQYTVPQLRVPSGGFNVGTIADYLGVPPKMLSNKEISALPFRVYAECVNEWFRDQNNMNPVHVSKDDTTIVGSNGSDQTTDVEKGGAPFIAAKYHDYFTSCLPNAQKIAANQVQFALNGLLPVNAYYQKSSFSAGDTITNLTGISFLQKSTSGGVGTATAVPATQNMITTTNGAMNGAPIGSNSTSNQITLSPNNLFADLNNTSVFDINELRMAFQIQKYYEKLARGGSRYTEFIKAFFNCDSPDGRMQRPEFLGGSRIALNVSQIEQTSATEANLTPQGNLVGMSATGDSSSDFTKSFTEHGAIIGLMVARYNHTYQQGLERFWRRKTVHEFYTPVMANIGEMPVMSTEIYANAAYDTVFGYQEAWADYRYKPSRCCSEMRSVHTTPLDSWHLADYYSAEPTLTDTWIREDKTMLDRCLAVTSAVSNQLFADIYIQCRAYRPMPVYSIPGLIDHH